MEPYITTDTLPEKSQEWLARIKPVNQHKMQFNKEKSALLVVDMQKFFLDAASIQHFITPIWKLYFAL
jgi:isochorismate hydrolase